MKKTLLLYLSLVPFIFTFVLSVIPLSSAFAVINYEDYAYYDDFVDFEYFDYFCYDNVNDSITSFVSSRFSDRVPSNFDNYIYFIYKDSTSNTGSLNDLSFVYHGFYANCNDITVYFENDNVIVYQIPYGYKFSVDSSGNISVMSIYFTTYILYDKTYGCFSYSDRLNQIGSWWSESREYTPVGKLYYTSTNFEDFPYADGTSHNSLPLNLSVSFSPSLSGSVDRSVGSGSNISYLQNLSMTVTNNSSKAVQYKFYIMKSDQTSHRPWSASGGDMSSALASHQVVYDDDPVFIYYSNEWVYSANLDNSSDWYNGHPQKQQKSTEWHYISSGSSQTINFKFSQINLQEGVSYTAIVEAILTDYDCASRLWVSSATSESVYSEYKQLSIDDKATVYSSSFNMLQYSDVRYDHNDDSNGINPYSDYSDLESYNWSYLAKEENGVTDYTNKNLYTDQNSWYRQSYNTSNINIPSSSASFNSSTTYISSFLSFVSSVLGFFPAQFLSVFTVGITSVVVIGLIKVVFR